MALLASCRLEGCSRGPVFYEGRLDWGREERHLPGWRNSLSGGPRWKLPPALFVDETEDGLVLEHNPGHELCLIAGASRLADCTARGSFRMLTERCRPLATDDLWNILGRVGPIVRMLDQRRYYQLCLEGLRRVVLYRRGDEEHLELAAKKIEGSPRRYYRLALTAKGETLTARLDGEVIFEVKDSAYRWGWAGVRSRALCRMKEIAVETTDTDDAVNASVKMAEDKEILALRERTPQAVLHKTLDVSGFKGMEIVQVIRVGGRPGFLFAGEGAIALADLECHEVWRRPLGLTNVSVAELDGPGKHRIVGIAADKILVLDAASGKVLRKGDLPGPDVFRQWSEGPVTPRFGGITPARLKPGSPKLGLIVRHETGGGSRGYWAYDDRLRPLWQRWIPRPPGAHMIQVVDIHGRGADEICAGMHILDHTGELVWSASDADIFPPHGGDHIDWVVMARLNPGEPRRIFVAMATGHEGLFVYDRESGKLLFRHQFGHVQSVQAGRFVPEREDMQLWAVTRWDSYGIACVVAPSGEVLSRAQIGFVADHVKPTNWTGDGIELGLPRSSGMLVSYDLFGLVNWQGRLAVPLDVKEIGWTNPREPVQGYTADVVGDGRDEVLIRRGDTIWIYTQGKVGE